MGGTCDQETGQCQCLEGVIGQNCDHCPHRWVLIYYFIDYFVNMNL